MSSGCRVDSKLLGKVVELAAAEKGRRGILEAEYAAFAQKSIVLLQSRRTVVHQACAHPFRAPDVIPSTMYGKVKNGAEPICFK